MGPVDSVMALLPPALQEALVSVDKLVGVQHAGVAALIFVLLFVLATSVNLLSLGGSSSAGRGLGRRKGNTVLLVGPCGGGKTALFHQVLYSVTPETVTSMQETQAQGTVTKASGATVTYTLMDFPGHERLRGEWVKHLKEGKLAGVVFVVDAVELSSSTVRGTAEFLYEVLTEPEMEGGPCVLIACHKADMLGAKPPTRVKTLLTTELDKLRKTRGATDAEGGEGRLPLGRIGEPLNLDLDAPSELSFAASSTKQTGELEKFIQRCLGVVSGDRPWGHM